MIIELNKNIKDLLNIKRILYTEGEEKFQKSLFILDSYIIFLEDLKKEYDYIEENTEEEVIINNILNNIEEFINKINKELGH